MEEDSGLTESLTQNFYKNFSTREKKMLAELFGPGYPAQDLPMKSVNHIVYKIRPSVIEKLKVSHLMRFLLQYFVLVESEKIELADDTTTDEKKATVLLDALSYKGTYAIGALYIALLDSSNEAFGPPTHYQLACELKRIIQSECASASLTLSDTSRDSEDSKQALEAVIKGLVRVEVTKYQGQAFCKELDIEFLATEEDTVELDSICKQWLKKKGTWAQLSDLVEALLLTNGLGRYSANLRAPVYQNLKVFLEGLKEEWTSIGKFIGYADSELEAIVNSNDTISAQLDEFLEAWKVPDCGQKTSVILRKLKNAARIKQSQFKTERGSKTVDLKSTAKQSSSADALHSDAKTTYLSSLKLNIIRSSEVTPSATLGTLLGDQNDIGKDTNDGSECNSFNSLEERQIPVESVSISSDSENHLVPSCDSQEETTTIKIKGESGNSPTGSPNIFPSKKHGQQLTVSEALTSETVSLEVSDGTELSEQIPPHHTHISEDLRSGIIVPKQQILSETTNHFEENLEVLPTTTVQTTSELNQLDKTPSGTPVEHTKVESEEEPLSVSSIKSGTYQNPSLKHPTDTPQNESVCLKEDTAEVHMPSRQKFTQKVGEYPIHDAVETNSVDRLDQVLSCSYDVNQKRKEDGRTALHVACYHGYVKAVKLLVANCIDINSRDKDGNHCLHFERTLESLLIVSCLLENGASSDPPNRQFCTPLVIACQIGDHVLETVECLLKHGASCDGLPKCSTSPLLKACENGNIGLVQSLLLAKASVDRKDQQTGETPLIKACFNIHVDIVKQLLLYRPNLEATDEEKRTPLTVAVVKGSLEIVRLLIEAGADMHSTRACSDEYAAQEFNITPLCDAFARGYLKIAKYLIEKGANINTTDITNQAPDRTKGFISPLSFACMTNQVHIVKYVVTLEQFEATLPFVANPIIDALKRGHDECVMILSEKYGGMEKLKKDANNQNKMELARLLSITKRLSGAMPTTSISKGSVDTTTDQQLSYTPKQERPLSHSESNSEESDSSNELTLCAQTKDDQPIQSNATEEFSIETFNALDVEEETPSSVKSNTNLVNQLNLPFSTLQPSNSPPPPVSDSLKQPDLPGGLSGYTSDEGTNPFKSLPKSPIVSDAEAEMPIQPMQLGDPDSLRSFQGSAVEVLYDFMQYLISACLQTKKAEDIIGKAEAFGDTKLVNFFTRYFFDIANIPSHELVSEFLQGFPSPMSFVFAARLCSKNDFYTVLKFVGREDFPDQLMLALHQFPNADNLPWSGSGVLNAFFSQSFYAGQPPSSPDLEPRRPLETQSAGPTEAYQFPEGGHRLGYGDKPPESQTSVQQKTLKATAVPKKPAVTNYSQLNDLNTCDESSDAPPDERKLTGTRTHFKKGNDDEATGITAESSHKDVSADAGTQFKGPKTSEDSDEAFDGKFLREKEAKNQLMHDGASNVTSETTCKEVSVINRTMDRAAYMGAEESQKKLLTDTGTQHEETEIEDSDLAPVNGNFVENEIKTRGTHTCSKDSHVRPDVHMEVSAPVRTENQPKRVKEQDRVENITSTLSTESDTCDQVVPDQVRRKQITVRSKTTQKAGKPQITVEYSASESEDESYSATQKGKTGYANAMSESSDSDKKSTPASVGTVEKVTKSSEHKQTVKTATASTIRLKQHKQIVQLHTSSKSKPPPSIPKHQAFQLKHTENTSKGRQVLAQTRTTHCTHEAGLRTPPIQKRKHSPVQPSKIPKPKPATTKKSNIPAKTVVPMISPDKKASATRVRPENITKSSPRPVVPTSTHKNLSSSSVNGTVHDQSPLKQTKASQSLKKEEKSIYSEDKMKGASSVEFINERIHKPEELFRKLSSKISNWKMLGRYLLIPDEDIDRIAVTHFSSEQEKVCKMLIVWRDNVVLKGMDFTYKTLYKALQYCMLDQLLPILEQHHLKNRSLSGSHNLTIHVPLTEFWETLRPFIDDKISNGYSDAIVTLRFE